MQPKTPVIIVGAGPIGLEVAARLKADGLNYIQLEAGQLGQTISWYPQQARFFSSAARIAIAGVPLLTPDQSKATKEEYLLYLRAVAIQFGLAIRTYERVVSIRRHKDNFSVETVCKLTGVTNHYAARAVVSAIGDMHSARRLDIAGEDLPFVSHYFQSPLPFFGRRLLIVGGRNSAVEAALRCHHAGAKVTIVYRGAQLPEDSIKYWLLPEIRGLIREGQIAFLPNTQIASIEPNTANLIGMQGQKERLAVDFVLLLTGYTMDATLLEQAGVELVGPDRVPSFDPNTMETNVPGLYVAGTATAGTQQRHKVFIETCHDHADRIAAALQGRSPPRSNPNRQAPET